MSARAGCLYRQQHLKERSALTEGRGMGGYKGTALDLDVKNNWRKSGYYYIMPSIFPVLVQ